MNESRQGATRYFVFDGDDRIHIYVEKDEELEKIYPLDRHEGMSNEEALEELKNIGVRQVCILYQEPGKISRTFRGVDLREKSPLDYDYWKELFDNAGIEAVYVSS